MKPYISSSFDQQDINRLFVLIDSIFRKRKDKAGAPYIGHCTFVAHNAYTISLSVTNNFDFADICYIVGLCHDVVEDCQPHEIEQMYNLIDLLWGDVDRTLVKLIKRSIETLTRRSDEKYSEYSKRVSAHPIARVVKCADALHNSLITRYSQQQINEMSQNGQLDDLVARCNKYLKRHQKLLALIQNEEQ